MALVGVGAGTDVAQETARAAPLRHSLAGVAERARVARATMQTI